jgi:hypothetical protein
MDKSSSMFTHRLKNLNVRYGSADFLVNAEAYYIVEDFDDCKEATFEKVTIIDALDKAGYVTSPECLGYLSETVLEQLNKDGQLCRQLGSKHI